MEGNRGERWREREKQRARKWREDRESIEIVFMQSFTLVFEGNRKFPIFAGVLYYCNYDGKMEYIS